MMIFFFFNIRTLGAQWLRALITDLNVAGSNSGGSENSERVFPFPKVKCSKVMQKQFNKKKNHLRGMYITCTVLLSDYVVYSSGFNLVVCVQNYCDAWTKF